MRHNFHKQNLEKTLDKLPGLYYFLGINQYMERNPHSCQNPWQHRGV
jgi:hypothetical protein